MSRTYQVTYKTYFNERLKEVSFHGKLTHPLYIQVTFDRKTTFYKSYYFELFSKPKYHLLAAGKKGGPSLEQVIAKEHELIDFVIDKTLDDFSLERFREKYLYYCRDLCDVTEEGFREYLLTFFHDKGMPVFAATLNEGSKNKILYDVVQDLKTALKPALYDELIENSFYYAPPYLPLFGFMMQFKKWPLLSLSVLEWTRATVKENFYAFLARYYPKIDLVEMVAIVDRWLKM